MIITIVGLLSIYSVSTAVIANPDSFEKNCFDKFVSAPDTNITIEGNIITSNYFDTNDSETKELKIVLENNEIDKVYLNGKKLSGSKQKKYQTEIEYTFQSIERAKYLADQSRKDEEILDYTNFSSEIQKAFDELNISEMDLIKEELGKALDNLNYIKQNNLDHNMDCVKNSIEKIDWEEFSKQFENIDEVIRESMHIIEDKEFQKAMDMSIDCIHDIVPEINEIVPLEDIESGDSENGQNKKIEQKEKDKRLENELMELEGK